MNVKEEKEIKLSLYAGTIYRDNTKRHSQRL